MLNSLPITTTVTVVKNVFPNPTVSILTVKADLKIDYHPGQFLMVSIVNPEGERIERPISIANAVNADGLIEFVVRIHPAGQLSQLISRAKPGDNLILKGPYGRFGQLALKDPSEIIFIAGGVGIAPIRSLIQHFISQPVVLPLSLYFGFRSPNDFLFEEEFLSYAKYKNLHLEVSISSDDYPNWKQGRGYIHHHVQSAVEFHPQKVFFICGPPVMVDSSKRVLMEKGFERKHIHLEAW